MNKCYKTTNCSQKSSKDQSDKAKLRLICKSQKELIPLRMIEFMSGEATLAKDSY